MKKLLIALAAAGLTGGIVLGVLAGIWVFRNVDARLLLTDQPANVQILGQVPVTADILNNLDIMLDTSITTTVPVDQRISVPVNDTLHIVASFDSDVPIKLNVPLNESITIDKVLDIDTVVKADLLGDTHDLALRGKIPVKAVVPVKLNIPIDQMVHLKFTAPVEARLQQALDVPLKADISTTIPIKSQMSVPVTSALKANVTIPQPADVIIKEANLRLPLRTLRLQLANDPDESAQPRSAAPKTADAP